MLTEVSLTRCGQCRKGFRLRDLPEASGFGTSRSPLGLRDERAGSSSGNSKSDFAAEAIGARKTGV